MLRVDITKRLGEFLLQAAFESEGRVTGLFGASGAGKTSLVNMIAGLLRPDSGTIVVDGETLDDTACRQQTASVEEPMRAQAYAECRRLRVAYWQVGASPNAAQPQAENANAPAAKAPLTAMQARQGAAWRTCAVTPNAPQC